MGASRRIVFAIFAVYLGLHVHYFVSHPHVPFMAKVAHLILRIQSLPGVPLFLPYVVPRVSTFDDGHVYTQDVEFNRTEDVNHTHAARIFVPHKEISTENIFVWVHGGGFVLGSPTERHIDETCRLLAKQSGVRLVAIHYRKAPNNHFLMGFEDIRATFDWIKETMPQVRRMALGGDSAGATLALSAAAYHPHKLQHLLLVYPGLHHGEDFAMTDAWILHPSVRSFFKSHHVPPSDPDKARDYHFFRELLRDLDDKAHDHLLQRLPSTHIISAGEDPLHLSSSRLETKLKRIEGLHVRHDFFPTSIHGFFCEGGYSEREEAVQKAAHGLRQSFDDKKTTE